jgi:hypothetical protein
VAEAILMAEAPELLTTMSSVKCVNSRPRIFDGVSSSSNVEERGEVEKIDVRLGLFTGEI